MASFAQAAMAAANRHPRRMLVLGCAVLALPAWRLWRGWQLDALGVNPLETLIHGCGEWAFILLLAAMTLGPLRRALMHLAVLYQCGWGKRLSDWNWLLRLRRPVGLAAFVYGMGHFVLYAWLDLGLDWRAGLDELKAKPFMPAGAVALLLLLPLAITSTDGWVLRLKQRWKVLHMLVYPAAGVALMHVILLSKPGMLAPYAYGAVLMPLLGYRMLQRRAHGLPPQTNADATVPERALASAPTIDS